MAGDTNHQSLPPSEQYATVNGVRSDKADQEKEKHDMLGLSDADAAAQNLLADKPRTDGKVEVKEDDEYNKLGYAFPVWKKCMILFIILLIQTSMNLNASIYGNAVDKLAEKYTITAQKARVGQMIFLVCYAFGCEVRHVPRHSPITLPSLTSQVVGSLVRRDRTLAYSTTQPVPR
jgi:hypothetical protein